jgi:hypothetical protein
MYTCSNIDFSCSVNDTYDKPIDIIDSSIMITPELLNKTNKYNKIFSIKNDLLKYLNNDTFEIDNILRLENNEDKEVINNISNAKSYISPTLTEMINIYDKFKNEFTKKQDELYIIEKKLKKNIENNDKDIKIIESLLDKTCLLSKNYIKEGDKNDTLIDKMIELSECIKDNNKIYEIKNKYIKSRKEIIEYMEIIKYINNYNLGNTCSVCLTNKVDTYYNPCGHTLCSVCSDKFQNMAKVREVYYKCFICREDIIDIRKLYFQ